MASRREAHPAPARPCEAWFVRKAKAFDGLYHILLDVLAGAFWRMSYFSKIDQHHHSRWQKDRYLGGACPFQGPGDLPFLGLSRPHSLQGLSIKSLSRITAPTFRKYTKAIMWGSARVLGSGSKFTEAAATPKSLKGSCYRTMDLDHFEFGLSPALLRETTWGDHGCTLLPGQFGYFLENVQQVVLKGLIQLKSLMVPVKNRSKLSSSDMFRGRQNQKATEDKNRPAIQSTLHRKTWFKSYLPYSISRPE